MDSEHVNVEVVCDQIVFPGVYGHTLLYFNVIRIGGSFADPFDGLGNGNMTSELQYLKKEQAACVEA